MKPTERRHIGYVIKIFFVVLPGTFLAFAVALMLCAVLLPVQVPAWLLSERSFTDTAPYRPVIQLARRFEQALERFAGNPWLPE